MSFKPTPKIYAGAKLRELRQRLGMSQKEFAKRLGVSLPYANQMENNHTNDAYHIVWTPNSPVK